MPELLLAVCRKWPNSKELGLKELSLKALSFKQRYALADNG